MAKVEHTSDARAKRLATPRLTPLVNARYAKNVPGRKTDVSDAGWLRQLHSYGLLRGSFCPEAEIGSILGLWGGTVLLPVSCVKLEQLTEHIAIGATPHLADPSELLIYLYVHTN